MKAGLDIKCGFMQIIFSFLVGSQNLMQLLKYENVVVKFYSMISKNKSGLLQKQVALLRLEEILVHA